MAESINIVTGFGNVMHITSADDGSLNAGIFGEGTYLLNRGQKMRAEIASANLVRIYDGDIVMQGRHGRIEIGSYKELTISNGSQGMKRNDLLVVRYRKDADTQVEHMELDIIKGEETSGTPTDPSYTAGDMFSGAVLAEYPLYRITVDGLTPKAPVRIVAISADLASGFAAERPKFSWNSTNTNDNSTSLINCFPYFGICFCKAYFSAKRALPSGYSYLIGTVENGYRPNYRQPLSAITAAGVSVPITIQNDGEVYIKPLNDLNAGAAVYLNGFWFV